MSFFLFFFSFFAPICFAQPSSNRAPTLVDAPIAAASITYLDGEDWLVSAVNMLTIAGTVPGDVISDLQRSGLIGDPLYELNWLQQSPTWWRAWTYTKSFSITPMNLEKIESGESDLLLVFDGIKMSSVISINGAQIGHTTNQFLRYSFSLSAAHRSLNNTLLFTGTGATDNTISITFDLLNDQTTEGRFMACSAGWDWAAYIWNTTTLGMSASGPTATRALTFGLWKSVYLATIETSSAAIMHVVPHVFYNGDFPVMPLSDVNNGGFTVNVRVHFWASATGAIGMLSVNGAWLGAHVSVPVNVPAGESNVSVTLNAPVGSVSLWWPAGTGGLQPLYEISAIFTPSLSSLTPITAEPRRIGFRYIALTTGNDTDAEWRAANAGGDGNANQGMMIRVNGAALMIRGANMIPQDEFEGRYDAIAFARMVKSSAEANMNLLRVWGGGVFAPSAFYDACDENGILVYHDMQFAQDGHSPLDQSPSQYAEFQHQVRRLSAHPSIAIWDGCNECHVILNTSTGVYASFVLQTVVGEDISRPVWPSCPSNGWDAGVSRLDSLPNGSPLGLLPAARPPTKSNLLPANCSFINDMDVDGDGDGPVPGATPQDCCKLCAQSQPTCASVVWEPSGNCWIKYDGGQPWPRANRTTCQVSGRVAKSTIEVHGPYQHGSGFPAVNGGGGSDLVPFDSGFPIILNPSTPSGLTFPSVFTSEFGATGFSSFESMSATLAPEHWSMHGGTSPDTCTTGGFEGPCNGTNTMSQRNYPQDNYLVSYFGLPRSSFDAVGAEAFKHQTYLSGIAMALNIKMKIETKRSANCFGTMIWQLGEVWPTGGWGSLEYSSSVPGGILGGRWRPTHHWYKSHLFSDVVVICGASGNVMIKNDRFTPFSGTFNITKLELATGIETVLYNDTALSLPAGPGAAQWLTVDPSIDGHEFVLRAVVIGADGTVVTNSFHPLLPPANWTTLPLDALVTAVVADEPNDDGSINVTLTSTKLAAFVHLTSLAAGRFSDNAFFLQPSTSSSSSHIVTFIPWSENVSVDELRASLRLDHLGAALSGARADGERVEAVRVEATRVEATQI